MRTLNWSFAVLLVAASNLHAQQGVDDLVAKYAQRVGGADRLHSVQSVRRIGKFYGGGGFEARLTNENKRPNKVREPKPKPSAPQAFPKAMSKRRITDRSLC